MATVTTRILRKGTLRATTALLMATTGPGAIVTVHESGIPSVTVSVVKHVTLRYMTMTGSYGSWFHALIDLLTATTGPGATVIVHESGIPSVTVSVVKNVTLRYMTMTGSYGSWLVIDFECRVAFSRFKFFAWSGFSPQPNII